jgi:hypothetical protein
MLNAVRLRQESVAAAIPGNLSSRSLPLLSIRTHGARRKQSGISTGRFLSRLHRANPTASWAQISTPHSEEKSIFDSEVELC